MIAECIAGVARHVFTITPDNPRALTADEYKDVLKKYETDASATVSIGEAVSLAIDMARATSSPVICLGSLYTYGAVLKALDEKMAI